MAARARRVHALLALAGALGLAACGNEFVRGSTSPPDGFPSIDRVLFGCPDLNGVYAWPGDVVDPTPAVEGAAAERTLDPFRLPNANDATGLSFDNTLSNAYYLVRARKRFVDGDGQTLWIDIGSREMGIGEYRCAFGWLEFKAEDATTRDGASLRIARGDDGSLVVAVHGVHRDAPLEHRYPEFFSPGGPERARVDTWRWHRLARLGDRVERGGRLVVDPR